MAFFTNTQAAIAGGRTVRLAALYEMEFASETGRYWDGVGLITVAGHTWSGIGAMVSLSAVPFGTDDEASGVTLTLSGVDPDIMALARAESHDVEGGDLTIYGQFLGEDLQALDDRWVVAQLVMDQLSYSATGVATRSITLSAESLWTGRNAAANAFFSDRDQQIRFAGDTGLEFVASMKNKKVKWPVVED